MGGQNSGEGRKGRCYLCRHGFDGRRHVAEVGLNPIVGPDLEVVAGAEESRHPRSGRDSNVEQLQINHDSDHRACVSVRNSLSRPVRGQ